MIVRKNYSLQTLTDVSGKTYSGCNFTGSTFVNCTGLTFQDACNLRGTTDVPDDSVISDDCNTGPIIEPEMTTIQITCGDGHVVTRDIEVAEFLEAP